MGNGGIREYFPVILSSFPVHYRIVSLFGGVSGSADGILFLLTIYLAPWLLRILIYCNRWQAYLIVKYGPVSFCESCLQELYFLVRLF